MGDRVTFLVASQARRESTEAALSASLTVAELRVLLAVHWFTGEWSRLSDQVGLEQVAEVAGLVGHKSRVAKALRRLEELGAVVYIPGQRGRGHRGTVGIPPPQKEAPAGHFYDEEKGPEKGPNTNGKGANPADKRGLYRPHPKGSQGNP